MAKLGIALGSGPRGLGFESRHSDHKSGDCIRSRRIFYWSVGIRKGGQHEVLVKNMPVACFLARERILPV